MWKLAINDAIRQHWTKALVQKKKKKEIMCLKKANLGSSIIFIYTDIHRLSNYDQCFKKKK